MSTFFELVTSLQSSIDDLDTLLSGGENETVSINGVNKNTISKAIKDNFSALQAMMIGRKGFATKLAMTANTSQPTNTIAEVYNDTTEGNNGVYGWTGSAWVKSPYDVNSLSVHFNYGNGANENRFWFDKATKRSLSNAEKLAVNGILDIQFINPDINYSYTLSVLTKSETTGGYGNRIIFNRSGGDSLLGAFTKQWDGSPINLNGINRLSITDTTWADEIIILIDYSVFANNSVVLNGANISISPNNYNFAPPETQHSKHFLYRTGPDAARIKIKPVDDSNYKKLVFSSTAIAMISFSNTNGKYNQYVQLPKSYEIAFDESYQTIGIDLTSPNWAANSAIDSLIKVSYSETHLRKDFIPIASVWNYHDEERVYIYPEFNDFFDLSTQRTQDIKPLKYQLFRTGDSITRATLTEATDPNYKKLVFGTVAPGFINLSNVGDEFGGYFPLPVNYEIEFTGNYQTIGIDLTDPKWVDNSAIPNLVSIGYDVASLRKDFIPIASVWNVPGRVYIYPEFQDFFNVSGNDVLTTNQQVPLDKSQDFTQIRTPDCLYGQLRDFWKSQENGGANIQKLSAYSGFRGKVQSLKPTSDEVLVWLMNSSPDMRIKVSELDLTKPLFVQLDYKIVSGGNIALMKYQQGFQTGKKVTGSFTLFDNGLINRAVMAYTVAELEQLALGGNTYIVDYFSRAAGDSGEIVFNNLHYYQSHEPVTNPVHQSDLKVANAEALNSVLLTDEIVKEAFSGLSSGSTSDKSHNIVLSGSSITWGDGHLDGSFVGYVDEFFVKNKIAATLLDSAESVVYSGFTSKQIFSNAIQYKGTGTKITGVGATVEFDITGNEVAVCHTSLRTLDFAQMKVKADGVVIGYFDNFNHSLNAGKTDSFIGNNSDVKFSLSSPMTYGHSVTVGGVSKSGTLLTSTTGVWVVPAEYDYIVIRQLDANGEPTHAIWFKDAPAQGAAIVVNYSIGQVLGHSLSTVGQLTGDDSLNEALYGNGSVSFDPANPSSAGSGMEFRSIDKDQYFIHKFATKATRKITIEIIEGNNPYFIFDHASTRFHNLMNAGIGGWALAHLINNDKVNDYQHLFKDFMPDIIINESSTNDDWSYPDRKISRTLTGVSLTDLRTMPTLELGGVTYQSGSNDYEVIANTGLISEVSKYSITSPNIVGSATVVGDLIRIGNYHGDNKQVAVRVIDTVNLTTGKVTFKQPLNAKLILNIATLADLVGAEISVRDLTGYADKYRDLITKCRAISPSVKIGITQPGLSNYHTRQLWGYENIHRQIASEFPNVFVVEITDWLHEFQKNNISGAIETSIVSTGFSSYTLEDVGHWQGFKVFVDGVDVYGKDCYIQSGGGYVVDQAATGASNDFSGNNQKISNENLPMKLVFTKNPPNGPAIKIQRADSVWSNDYAHTNQTGIVVYGQAYADALNREL
ncbi:hypothetical protein A9Q81_20680 [Gammaproteobacteria bacterium 42_54_T18]|nr:hypothetical protein A9Q81_20680 [Gammaproteobacteria bacterium 42_54_T18]